MNINSNVVKLTQSELSQVYDIASNVIENLPPSAIQELLGGNTKDLEKLFEDILYATNQVVNNNNVHIGNFGSLSNFEKSFDETLKIQSYNYFKTTMLPSFHQHWRNIEMGNIIQLYPWCCILASRGSGKCESPETEVVMYDGTLKQMKDIQVGDQVMGIDSTPRTVLSKHEGEDEMYEILQTYGESYIANSEHILHFKRGTWDNEKRHYVRSLHQIDEMPVKEFHIKTDYWKSQRFGYRVKGWDLPAKEQKIDPYFLGCWLADGNSNCTSYTKGDFEILDWIEKYVETLGLKLKKLKSEYHYSITSEFQTPGMKNVLLDLLREYNLINNKHIPDNYLYGSREQRMQLLAGLLDGDGYLDHKKCGFSFGLKEGKLPAQIQHLCWSLGFRCSLFKQMKKLNYREEPYLVNCISISGFIEDIPTKVKRKQFIQRKRYRDPQISSLKTKQLGRGKYCGITLDGDGLYLGKDGTVKHNSFEVAQALPIWRMWRYRKPEYFERSTVDNRNSKETVLITNEAKLGRRHLAKIVAEIESNNLLHEVLMPDSKRDSLGKDKINTKNGASLDLRSFGSFIRGLHVGFVIVDDFLDKSALYSQEQRDKFKEVFDAEIKSIVEPHGGLVVSGTPFFKTDLYGHLKNDPMFKVFEYPAIDINGELLAPDRYDYKQLMDLKKSLGTIVFSREYLVTPISDASSIFPWEYLNTSIVGMENISLTDNIDSYPIKFKRIVVGVDFAKSGNVGADYTVISVWGKALDGRFYLIHVERGQGWSTNEQVSRICRVNNAYKPNKIKAEDNGFQSVIVGLVKERGVTCIEGFTTTVNKKDDLIGLPAISVMFERGEIKIPYKEGRSRDMANLMLGEFNSIGFTDQNKLQAIDGHDDMCISAWISLTELRQKTSFKIEMI